MHAACRATRMSGAPEQPLSVGISSSREELAVLAPLLERAAEVAGDVPALLALAVETGRTAPRPGAGGTARLWEILASVTAVDVAAGRILEPHLDAVAILAQAGGADGVEGAWGVFAAEDPGLRLSVAPAGGTHRLSGSKPWCSLAGQLDHAVVTASIEGQGRSTFAVDLRAPGVRVEDPPWTSRGMREIPSGTVHFDGVEAVPVGEPGWYFSRPGFAWGGMGVAACWFGGAVALARDFTAALGRREPDQLALAHLGEVDRTLTAIAGYMARTAQRIDAGKLSGSAAWGEALRVRGTVATAVERIQSVVSRNLGPGPLAFDEAYGKRMADLSLYIRQHHAMRDDAQLGALTLTGDRAW